MNWHVSFRDGRGTLTTGRPFWMWIEASVGEGMGGERLKKGEKGKKRVGGPEDKGEKRE